MFLVIILQQNNVMIRLSKNEIHIDLMFAKSELPINLSPFFKNPAEKWDF